MTTVDKGSENQTNRFPEYGSDYSFSSNEEKVLAYWKNRKVFEKTVQREAPKGIFYFYDGPPFATGLPHYGHILAGMIKDVVPRFKTMQGYKVERRFGWDCHGLPVEFEMEKTLKLDGSAAIREYGVGKFNEACRGIVLRYSNEWKKTVERMGRWVDMENDYKTMNPEFMESVWWVFKQLWDKGLVYEGIKVVPYSWRLTAPLSNFEASLNYKDVQDPAITVLFPLTAGANSWQGNTAFAVWTTTPWTLPSNLAIAAHADSSVVTYGRYQLAQPMGTITHVIVADGRAEAYGLKDAKTDAVSNETMLKLSYAPLFSTYDDDERKKEKAFRVLDGSKFVSATDGTCLVHMAPAFGEDDYWACHEAKISLVDPTSMEAKFLPEVSAKDARLAGIVGKFVKDADKDIIKIIKDAGRLLKHETLNHSYPHCERTDTPLIYKAISSWFVKVESIRDQMVVNNKQIHWTPSHIRDGRFGKWLEGARDWCISRNRFWGTPIPVWTCEKCSHREVVGSREALDKLLGEHKPDLHMHFIDEKKAKCSKCGEVAMKRTPEVLDCWFESGSMPYAQEHYPFENKQKLDESFPADFIAEGLDQTRGWFYTLTVLSTALFNKPAFKNCVVNGIVLAEDGRKMSKRLKNYPDPTEVFAKYGADATRLYLMQSPAVAGDDLRFSEKGLLETMRAVMIPLWNAYSFFASYANIDGWSHEQVSTAPAVGDRTVLDRWILSELAATAADVEKSLGAYELASVAPHLMGFIDNLTNWYIRLNRERFWNEAKLADSKDKQAAYATLWQVLDGLSKLLAPGLPFIAETLFAALRGTSLDSLQTNTGFVSVHEGGFPRFEKVSSVDGMLAAKNAILVGRALRGEAKIGLRQPLPKLRVAGARIEEKVFLELIKQEVNVKELEFVDKAADLVEESAKPNFKTLGKKVGGAMKTVQAELLKWGTAEIAAFETNKKATVNGFELTTDDVEIVRKAKPGRLAQAMGGVVAELSTEISPELKREGLQREIINRIQQQRKEKNFKLADRIVVRFDSTGAMAEILAAEVVRAAEISRETLASKIEASKLGADAFVEDFGEHGRLVISVEKVS